jgi:hypothetical protein
VKCAKCGADLPLGAKFCANCGTPASAPGGVATGGGAYFGSAQTQSGNITARDTVVYGNYDQIQAASAGGFQDVYETLDELRATVEKIEEEAARGEQADPNKIRQWLDKLTSLAPDVTELVVNALTNPGAAVVSGVKLAADAFRGKAGG